MDRNSPSTATQANSGGNSRIGRRTFVKGLGVSAAGAGALGLEGGPVGRSSAFVVSGTALGIGAAAVAGGLAGAYLTKKVGDYFTGDDIDVEALKDKQAAEKHTQITKTALSVKATDESLLQNMSNLLQNAENAAYGDAKVAAINELENGSSESVVNNAAVDAVDSFYSTQQTNLVEHYNLQIGKIKNIHNLILNEANLNMKLESKVYDTNTDTSFLSADTGNNTYTSLDSKTVDLVDTTTRNINPLLMNVATDPSNYGRYYAKRDTTMSYAKSTFVDFSTVSASSSAFPSTAERLEFAIRKPDSQVKTFLNMGRYASVWDTILNQYATVKSDIETWVTNVYPKYTQGDIDASQLVSPSDIANMAGEETDNGFARSSAELAALGVEGAEHSYLIRLEKEGVEVNGTVYVDGKDTSTNLELGTTYSPSDFSTVYLAFTDPDTGESGTIVPEQDFTILEGVNPSGESVDEVTFKKNNQQTVSDDIQELSKELDELTKLQNEIEEQESEIVEQGTGGGGGFLDGFGGSSNLGILAAGGAVLVYLLGNNNNN